MVGIFLKKLGQLWDMSPLKVEESSLSTQTEHKVEIAHEHLNSPLPLSPLSPSSVMGVMNGRMVTNIYHEVGKIGGCSTFFLFYINHNLAIKK